MRRPSQFLPLIAGAVALFPLLFGVPAGDDWFIELVRAQEYQRAWAGGDVLPTWAPEVLEGFGGRDFLFFPPLFPALAAAIAWVTGTIGSGVVLAVACVTIVAMASAHRAGSAVAKLLQVAHPDAAGDITAAAYVLAPFIVFDRLGRSSFAELTALALLPLAIWALAESRRRPARAATLAAAAVAGVALSHLLTVFIGGAAVLMVWILLGRERTAGLPILGGAVAGLSVSAWFWVPLLDQSGTVRRDELTKYGLAASENLIPLTDQLSGGEVAIGPGAVILAAVTLLLAWRGRGHQIWRWAVAAAVLVVVLTAVTSPLAAWLWRWEPLAIVQFPWRLWSMHALIGSVALGLAASIIVGSTLGRIAVTAVLVVAAAVPLSRVGAVDGSWTQDVEALLAARDLPYQATIGFEYLPPNAGLGMWLTHDRIRGPILRSEGGTVVVTSHEPYRVEFDVDARETTAVWVAAWDVPEWQVSGAAQRSAGEGGTLMLVVDPGETTVVVEYAAPPLRRQLERATPLIAMMWLAVLFVVTVRSREPTPP